MAALFFSCSGAARLRAIAMTFHTLHTPHTLHTLHYLDFDYSEDDAGCATWDAMASVRPAQLGAVQAEVALVLHWAQQEFADGHGPLDEGGEWDHDLQCLPEGERYTLTLTISGTPAFGAAWRAQWGSD